jgi:hypothetical protein
LIVDCRLMIADWRGGREAGGASQHLPNGVTNSMPDPTNG